MGPHLVFYYKGKTKHLLLVYIYPTKHLELYYVECDQIWRNFTIFDPIFGMRCTKAICTNKTFDDGLANKKMLISQIGPSSRYDGPIFYPIFLLTITI